MNKVTLKPIMLADDQWSRLQESKGFLIFSDGKKFVRGLLVASEDSFVISWSMDKRLPHGLTFDSLVEAENQLTQILSQPSIVEQVMHRVEVELASGKSLDAAMEIVENNTPEFARYYKKLTRDVDNISVNFIPKEVVSDG